MEVGAEVLVTCRRVGISQRQQVKVGGLELQLTLLRGVGLLPEIAEVNGVGVTRAWQIAIGMVTQMISRAVIIPTVFSWESCKY